MKHPKGRKDASISKATARKLKKENKSAQDSRITVLAGQDGSVPTLAILA